MTVWLGHVKFLDYIMKTKEQIEKARNFARGAAWCGGQGGPAFPNNKSIEWIKRLADTLEAQEIINFELQKLNNEYRIRLLELGSS